MAAPTQSISKALRRCSAPLSARSRRCIEIRAVIEVPTAPAAVPLPKPGNNSLKQQPTWTDTNHISSKIADWIINTKPTYQLATWLARRELITTAEQAGLHVQQHIKQMEQHMDQLQELYQHFVEATPDLTYPDYYLKTFHGYDAGNLSWQAAFEMEPVTHAVALRCYKGEGLTAQQAMEKLRQSYNTQIQAYYHQHRLVAPQQVLDIGCSTGISTHWYQKLFPAADMTGLDLSPYFLAVAEYTQRRQQQQQQQHHGSNPKHVNFIRGLAEATGLPTNSLDLVMFSFVAHECPQSATREMIREARRILRPGGVVCFVDNNPQSSVLQQLPPFLAILIKSGEPWTDEYYSMDLAAEMTTAGFRNVEFREANSRHCTVFGIA